MREKELVRDESKKVKVRRKGMYWPDWFEVPPTVKGMVVVGSYILPVKRGSACAQ